MEEMLSNHSRVRDKTTQHRGHGRFEMCGRLLGEEGKQSMKNGYAYDDSATVCFPLGWVLPQQEGRRLA